MAYTFTKVTDLSFGNKRGVLYDVTLDDAYSGTVATPLGVIDYIEVSPISCASVGMGIIFKINTTTASAAANGSVFISSNTDGDHLFMTVFGRS